MSSALSDTTLRTFLCGTTSTGDLAEIIEGPGLAGLEAGGAAEADTLSRRTLEKLSRGETLNSSERFHLEAIIIPDRRPAIDVVDGDYQTRHADWLHLNDKSIRTRLRGAFLRIGRVELPNHPTLPYGGTAFVVGDGLLMTNRHVAELFAEGIGLRGLKFISGLSGGIDFLRERRSSREDFLDFSSVVMIHPY